MLIVCVYLRLSFRRVFWFGYFLALFFFFFKQKTAYEMRISDWSSDVCSSDLKAVAIDRGAGVRVEMVKHGFERIADGGLVPVEKIGRASCRERVCQYV